MGRVMGYQEWYGYVGHQLNEDLCSWYINCPSHFLEGLLPDIQDILDDEYESYVSDMEDYEYECYKEGLI